MGAKLLEIQIKFLCCFLQLNLQETDLSFWYLSHHLTWHCFNISEDLQEICKKFARHEHKIVIVFGSCVPKIIQTITKTILRSYVANLCKFSVILEQCQVKSWLNYRNSRSVSWRLSCKKQHKNLIGISRSFAPKFYLHHNLIQLCIYKSIELESLKQAKIFPHIVYFLHSNQIWVLPNCRCPRNIGHKRMAKLRLKQPQNIEVDALWSFKLLFNANFRSVLYVTLRYIWIL